MRCDWRYGWSATASLAGDDPSVGFFNNIGDLETLG